MRIAETIASNRPEMPLRCRLNGHQPAERAQACIHVGPAVGGHAGLNQCLTQAGIVVGKHVFKPDPIFTLIDGKTRHQFFGQRLAQPQSKFIRRLQQAKCIQTQQRKGPGTR